MFVFRRKARHTRTPAPRMHVSMSLGIAVLAFFPTRHLSDASSSLKITLIINRPS